jgi:hypothetical protein
MKRRWVIAIIACLGLVAIVILGWLEFGPAAGGPRLKLAGGGETTVGQTSVQYVFSDRGIALAVWWADVGKSESGSQSSLFSATARGSFSSADGKRVNWSWRTPRENGGDFEIEGAPYDLANGKLFLLSTKDGQLGVTQLDVDLSQVQPTTRGFEALAKKEPRIAKFIAEASGQK